MLNLVKIYGLHDAARQRYGSPWSVKVKARECINCGACLEKCPQGIHIPARMHEAVTLLDPDAGSIAVDTSVDALSATGSFVLRLIAHSLATENVRLEANLWPRNGTSFDSSAAVFDSIPPFERVSRTIPVSYPSGAERIAFGMDLRAANWSEHVEKQHLFTVVKAGLDADWEGDGWVNIAVPPEAFTADGETASLHGARFKLSYDSEGLLLLVGVRDDFLVPSREDEHRGKLVDSVELFLDGRVPGRVGRARYEKGVHQVTLYPGDPGNSGPFVHSRERVALELQSERTGEGYRLRVRIPFSGFAVGAGMPREIGFDLAVNTANAAGECIAQYVWAGGSENGRDASGFREVWLV